MRLKRIFAVLVATCMAAVITACGDSSSSSDHKKQYATVYTSQHHVYCKGYKKQDDGSYVLVWYILYMNNQAVLTNSLATSTISNGSWQSTSVAPAAASLSKSNQVVEEDESGDPTTTAESSDSVPSGDAVIDDSTTDQEVQTDVTTNDGTDVGGDNGGDNVNGGGDNGGSDNGGGDTGGGDAGGGGDN